MIPISYNQEGLLFTEAARVHKGLEPIPLHRGLQINVKGQIDGSLLEYALNILVSRHDALRASFHRVLDRTPGEGDMRVRIFRGGGLLIPGLFVQCISQDVRVGIESVVASSDDLISSERDIRSIVESQLTMAFSYCTAPLFRTLLIRSGPGESILLLVFHQLICDDLSLRGFALELKYLYANAVEGRASSLRQPVIQHSEFARWQKTLSTILPVEALAFWDNQWAEFATSLVSSEELPFAVTRSNESYRVDIERHCLGPEIVATIREFLGKRDLTAYMLCFAAISILLSEYCNRSRVAFRRDFNNRALPKRHDAIGWFATTHIVGINVRHTVTAIELLGIVRETIKMATVWQHVPQELVQHHAERVQLNKCITLDPDVVRPRLTMTQCTHFTSESLFGRATFVRTGVSNPLQCLVNDHDDDITIVLRYSRRTFPLDIVKGLARQIEYTIKSLICDPYSRVDELILNCRRILPSLL